MKVGILRLDTLAALPGSTLSATQAVRLCAALTHIGADPLTVAPDEIGPAVAAHEAALERDRARIRALRAEAARLNAEARQIEAGLPEKVRLKG